jgi:uncharacterized protein YndB with AHSA1/START domain
MADLRIEREFRTTPERLFEMITTPEGLAQWCGPEGMHVPEGDLDLSRAGPWWSVMQSTEGARYKVSGHVTHVDPPRSVGFTWAWHDDADRRGEETHVTFTIRPTDTGARLVLDHVRFATAEAAQNHDGGWSSSLNKLSALLG